MGTTEPALVERVRRGVIGEGAVLDGPFGPVRVTYADYTASGRSLDFVEDVIRECVLPWYANTHTESSGTGLRTNRLREQARRVVADAVGAGDEHVVLFCGSGATAAVNKLVGILELRRPYAPPLPPDERPVVLVGPYEHHSNELPWRESVADVVVIGEDEHGHIDVDELRAQLVAHAGRPLRIGSFSAASNVTGVLTDADAISTLLHEHGTLAFWDYAAAAPYVPIRVAASAPGRRDDKDAVFLSPHKLVGGPQTPGVLVVRRDLVRNAVPTVPGGGTVAFVHAHGHRYLDDPVAREEGGTPAIVESIRAGLVLALKEAVGADVIQAREEALWQRAHARWAADDRLELLGSPDARRLPIVSFRVRAPHGRYLHHNFVVAVLNDLFGIQARGGCSCAGPYGHRLLAIDAERSAAFQDEIDRGCTGVKPGWTRLGFNYFFSDEVADYLIEAVELLAREGYRLLPEYRFDPETGLWWHAASGRTAPFGLDDVSFGADGTIRWPAAPPPLDESVLPAQLQAARDVLASRPGEVADEENALPAHFEELRWFALPLASLERPP